MQLKEALLIGLPWSPKEWIRRASPWRWPAQAHRAASTAPHLGVNVPVGGPRGGPSALAQLRLQSLQLSAVNVVAATHDDHHRSRGRA